MPVGGAEPPESYAEYIERFEASYTMPATGEIAEAQEARNLIRRGTRLPEGEYFFGNVDLKLSPRFCGLPYENGPSGFDCSPDDPMAYDGEWMLKCCALFRPHPLPTTHKQSAYACLCVQTMSLPLRYPARKRVHPPWATQAVTTPMMRQFVLPRSRLLLIVKPRWSAPWLMMRTRQMKILAVATSTKGTVPRSQWAASGLSAVSTTPGARSATRRMCQARPA